MQQEKTLLDAISNSIENPLEKPDEQPDKGDEPVLDGQTEETPAAEGPAADAEPSVEASGEAEGEAKPDSDKPADGDPAASDDSGKPGEKKADEKKPDEKKLDPINDPIPANMHARTKERITSLVGIVRKQQQTLEDHQGLFKSINDTGVSPENFAKTLTFLRHFNSPKAEDREVAFNFLASELRALAITLGKKMPGGDALEGHQDLIDAVAAQSISQQYAEEIAANRNKAKLETDTATARAESDTQWNAARDAAVADLNELGATLKATDPQYEAKVAQLAPKLQELTRTAHPSTWAASFQKLYREAKTDAAPAAALPTQKPNGGPTPLRANKQPSGDGKKQPTSMLDAVNAALGAR